jgi:hypothetical protein
VTTVKKSNQDFQENSHGFLNDMGCFSIRNHMPRLHSERCKLKLQLNNSRFWLIDTEMWVVP